MRVLAISPHADDIEIGAGGTLIKHRDKGDNIVIAVLFSDDNLCGDPDIRIIEQQKSCQELDAEVLFFKSGNSDKYMIHSMDEEKADLIYVPFWKDTHQDHVRSSQIGLSLTRKGVDFLYYDSGSAISFVPNYISHIDWLSKKNLLHNFSSQADHMKIKESNVEGFRVGRLSWK